MTDAMRLDRLPAVVAVCGALLLGWSVNGVASVDAELRASATTPRPALAERADPCDRRPRDRF